MSRWTTRAAKKYQKASMENFKNLIGLPPLASEQGERVDLLIIYVHWLMIALFVGWLAYFIYAIFRFHHTRNPKADYIGVKNHFSSWIEASVALVEVVLLLAVALPVWAKHVEGFPKESEATVVQVVAQQFAWNVRYPGKDATFGKQDMKLVKSAITCSVLILPTLTEKMISRLLE